MHKTTKLAFHCMFDIGGTEAQKYMNSCIIEFHNNRRDVSLIGAVRAAGDFLRLGIKQAKNKYPELIAGVNNE